MNRPRAQGRGLGAAEASKLAGALQTNTTLRALTLYSNALGPHGIAPIATVLIVRSVPSSCILESAYLLISEDRLRS